MTTITINMHQRTATDSPRAKSNYAMVTNDFDKIRLVSTSTQWEGWRKIADVEVEHPEIMFGSSADVHSDFTRAALKEALRLNLVYENEWLALIAR